MTKSILASHKNSTKKVYGATWKKFSSWCATHGIDPLKPRTRHILSFLQEGLELDLSTNTLRRQIVALRSTLQEGLGVTTASHTDVTRFLKGVSQIIPPVVHKFSTWDLHLALGGLIKKSFEPLHQADFQPLTLKTLLLTSMTSAQMVSKLGALSVNPNLYLSQRQGGLKT